MQPAARHRRAYWTAVVVAVSVVVAGAVLAVSGAGSAANGPAAAVLRYFADLQRGDAAAALAAGRVPPGRRDLLTPETLAEQQGIAPIRDVTVVGSTHRGRRADVRVRYALAFPGGTRAVRASLGLRERAGRWLLDRSAIAVVVRVSPAGARASLAGRPAPSGPVLLFPGALPIRFDSPFLALPPATDTVGFRSPPEIDVAPRLTRTGRRSARAALGGALRHCLASPAPGCPLPNARAVPGSVRSATARPVGGQVAVVLTAARAGVLDVRGQVRVRLRYLWLDFHNRPHPVSGTVALPVHARAYAVAPLHLVWRP